MTRFDVLLVALEKIADFHSVECAGGGYDAVPAYSGIEAQQLAKEALTTMAKIMPATVNVMKGNEP